MKIAQLVSNIRKVYSASSHAIYSHAAWLTNGLATRGHEVHLYASGDSDTRAQLHSVTEKAMDDLQYGENLEKLYVNLLISKCYEQAKNFDIVHSHFSLLSSFYANLTDTPTVFSIHSPVEDRMRPLLAQFKNNKYISFSLAQRKILPELNWVANIYHGVDMNVFSYNAEPGDYFLYLGRITKEKGVHLAIEAAKKAGVPLVIAGRSYPTESYWHEEIEKHIDGKTVKYVGEADLAQKIDLLRNAQALLFPTQYDEVFGYVMIEAMACGTPVIGWNKGSVPEVVAHKKTGFVVDSVDEMTEAIRGIGRISRESTRKRAEIYFSVEKMVAGYEKVYKRVIEERQFRAENHKS